MKIDNYDYKEVKQRLKQGLPVDQVSRFTGVSKTTIYRIKQSKSFKNYKEIAVDNAHCAKTIYMTVDFPTLPKRKKFLGIF